MINLIQQLPASSSNGVMQIVFAVLGGGTIGIIITSIVQWIRFKSKDKSETHLVDAQTVKTDAEALKIKAEAHEIKAKAEVTVADAALKLAQRLSEECDIARKQLERTQEELDKTAQQLRSVTTQLHFVQAELDDERHRNNEIMKELKLLKEEIDRLKVEHGNQQNPNIPKQ